MTLVSLAKYAGLHGARKQAATRWKARGTLVFCDDLVDVEASDERMRDAALGKFGTSTHSVNRQPNGRIVDGAAHPGPGLTLPEAQVATMAEQLVTFRGPMKLHEAQALKETYLARTRQLEYDLRVGNVVLVSDVAAGVGKEYARVRTALLAIPTKVTPRLVNLATAREIEAEVRSLIYEAMDHLTADRDAENFALAASPPPA